MLQILKYLQEPTEDAYYEPKYDDDSPYYTEDHNDCSIEIVVAVTAGTTNEVFVFVIVVGERTKHREHQHEEVYDDHRKR